MKVISTKDSISIIVIDNGLVSIANVDNLKDGRWWISRVNILEKERGKGLGSKMLKLLIDEVSKYGHYKIIVAPGGYEGNEERQNNFYLKNGFVKDGDFLSYVV